MNQKLDIIDRLDGEEGYVKLSLKQGRVEFGTPTCITYLDDEDGMPTQKRILFRPYAGLYSKDYGLEDIESYEPIEEADIPKHK